MHLSVNLVSQINSLLWGSKSKAIFAVLFHGKWILTTCVPDLSLEAWPHFGKTFPFYITLAKRFYASSTSFHPPTTTLRLPIQLQPPPANCASLCKHLSQPSSDLALPWARFHFCLLPIHLRRFDTSLFLLSRKVWSYRVTGALATLPPFLFFSELRII